MNYFKAKITIIIHTFIRFSIILHNVTLNNNLNIIYCKDPNIIVYNLLKFKIDSLQSIYETKRNWTLAYNIAFLSGTSEKCILWD